MLRYYDQVLDAPAQLRDGTHRAASLEDTWRRFNPAARKAGITRIADLTGLDTLGVPVFAAIRPMGKSLSTQQGKGISVEAARVSALMESLETFTAENIANAAVRGGFRTLAKKRNVVDVRQLPLAMPAAPTRTHERAGRKTHRKKLDLDARWGWLEGFDLIANEPILVPVECVTLDTTFERPPTFDISSNGLASGNVRVEAVVHGLCEVIEREAEGAWRRAGGDRRLVLDTIDDRICRDLIDQIAKTGARVFVWDLACEHGITAICAGIMEDPHEPTWRQLGFYQGFGAHWLPEIAIARALTEAAQTRLTYIAGARDDFFPFDYERATDPNILEDMWQLATTPCDEPVDFADLPRIETTGLGDALVKIAAPLDQVIVVDITHPKLRVPVVKVIVPGLATDVEALG